MRFALLVMAILPVFYFVDASRITEICKGQSFRNSLYFQQHLLEDRIV